MRIPGVKTLRRAALQLAARVRPCDVVLGYHRVTADGRDPFGLAVSASTFEAHAEIVARTGRAAPLDGIPPPGGFAGGPGGRIAITFDDGYLDNLAVAAPILRRLGLPFTVFVTTGNLGRPFWWHRLARGLTRRAERGALAERYEELAALDVDARAAALGQIDAGDAVEREARAMTADELRQLAAVPGADLGAHGVTHAALDRLAPEALREEVEASGATLGGLLGRPVRHFSYPHGRTSAAARGAVEAAGYAAAFTSDPSPVFRRADRFLLPRLWVPQLDGARFARWLGRWTGA